MELAQRHNHVIDSRGSQTVSRAKIDMTAHAFSILSSGLYSDKISAVLREIGCNAVDAHIEAGTPDLPIEVKLPTQLDQQFYIKDWGPGLNPEQIKHLYLTYFRSTKQLDNTQTGAFGLGSKSPLSYTDSFTVMSVTGGVKRIYAVYVANDGFPTVDLLAETKPDNDWQHGVSIGFPVKPNDVTTFHSKAPIVFRWFNTYPRVIGAAKPDPIKWSHKTDEFGTIAYGEYPRGLAPAIVMGGVRYKISGDHQLSDNLELFMDSQALVLFAPIGAVSITPSRETLQFDEKTRAYLTSQIHKAAKHVIREFLKKQNDTNLTLWGRRCNTAKSGEVSWLKTLSAKEFDLSDGEIEILQSISESMFKPTTTGGTLLRKVCDKTIKKEASSLYVPYDPQLIVALNDSTHAYARIRSAILDGNYKNVIYVASGESIAQAFVNEIGGIPIVKTSTLPLPVLNRPKRDKAALNKALADKYVTVDRFGGDTKTQYCCLASIPDNMKYFVMRLSGSGWNKPQTIQMTSDTASRVLPAPARKTIQDFARLVSAAKIADAGGCFEVTYQESRSLQLEKNGFCFAGERMTDILDSAEMKRAIKKAKHAVPFIRAHQPNYHAHSELASLAVLHPEKFVRIKPHLPQSVAKDVEALAAYSKSAEGHRIDSLRHAAFDFDYRGLPDSAEIDTWDGALMKIYPRLGEFFGRAKLIAALELGDDCLKDYLKFIFTKGKP